MSASTNKQDFNMDKVALCQGCDTVKHLNSDGLCGRCVRPDKQDDLDEILATLQKECGEAWEKYVGSEDDLEGYDDDYGRAYQKAKAALKLRDSRRDLEAQIQEVATLHDSSIGRDPAVERYVKYRYDKLEAALNLERKKG